jgi:hypothetical protein
VNSGHLNLSGYSSCMVGEREPIQVPQQLLNFWSAKRSFFHQ